MKLTVNALETLRYILNFLDNPQNSDKKRLLDTDEDEIRVDVENKILPFIESKKKEMSEYIKAYNTALMEKRRELNTTKIKPELYQEKINEDETVKRLFTELQEAKTRIGNEEFEFELSEEEKKFCFNFVDKWNKEIGWEKGEGRVGKELLEKLK